MNTGTDQKRSVRVVLDVSLGDKGTKGVADLASSVKAAGDVAKSTRDRLGAFGSLKPTPTPKAALPPPEPKGTRPEPAPFFRSFAGPVSRPATDAARPPAPPAGTPDATKPEPPRPAIERVPLALAKATTDNTAAVNRSTAAQANATAASVHAMGTLAGAGKDFRTAASVFDPAHAGTGKGGAIQGYTPPPVTRPADPHAAKQMDLLRTLGNMQLGGFAGRIGRVQSVGMGLEGMGAGKLGGVIGRAAPVIAAVGAAADVGKSALTMSHDTRLTSGQMGRRLLGELPGGEHIKSWADAFSGRAAGMENVEIESAKRQAQIGYESQNTRFQLQYNPRQAGLQERADQFAKAAPVVMGPIDRSTGTGERDFREKSRVLPVQRQIAEAERNAAAATKERQASEGELAKLTKREVDLRNQQAKLQDKLNRDTGSGVDRQKIIEDLSNANKALDQNMQARQTAAEGLVGARQREGEAKGQVGMRRADLAEAQAANLEERAATSATGARRLGGMNPLDRQFSVQSLKALQQYGPDKLSPEMLAQAQAIAPETAGKIIEKKGSETKEFKELQQIAPADFAGDPEKLRQQANEARDNAERLRMESQAAVAKSGADAGKELGGYIYSVMEKMVENAKREIETRAAAGKNKG